MPLHPILEEYPSLEKSLKSRRDAVSALPGNSAMMLGKLPVYENEELIELPVYENVVPMGLPVYENAVPMGLPVTHNDYRTMRKIIEEISMLTMEARKPSFDLSTKINSILKQINTNNLRIGRIHEMVGEYTYAREIYLSWKDNKTPSLADVIKVLSTLYSRLQDAFMVASRVAREIKSAKPISKNALIKAERLVDYIHTNNNTIMQIKGYTEANKLVEDVESNLNNVEQNSRLIELYNAYITKYMNHIKILYKNVSECLKYCTNYRDRNEGILRRTMRAVSAKLSGMKTAKTANTSIRQVIGGKNKRRHYNKTRNNRRKRRQ
jgi:hypothetical protein